MTKSASRQILGPSSILEHPPRASRTSNPRSSFACQSQSSAWTDAPALICGVFARSRAPDASPPLPQRQRAGIFDSLIPDAMGNRRMAEFPSPRRCPYRRCRGSQLYSASPSASCRPRLRMARSHATELRQLLRCRLSNASVPCADPLPVCEDRGFTAPLTADGISRGRAFRSTELDGLQTAPG